MVFEPVFAVENLPQLKYPVEFGISQQVDIEAHGGSAVPQHILS
ncbi:hypothetical protein [Azohydromonas caseinilytica]|nr:hypothetical protein [Azohydromonas caseinilytica]